MMGYEYGCGILGGGWFGMILIPLILIGIIVYVVLKLSKNGNIKNERGIDDSIEILNERFARGEIGEEEYKQKKSLLLRR